MRAAGNVLAICAAVAGLLVLASCGGEPKEPHWYPYGKPRNEDWHSPIGMLVKYDANHDGTLTRAELEAGLKSEFDSYDKNHSGCLDADEVRVINEQRTKSDESAASPLIDWGNTGCLGINEYSATARSLFEQLDHNGDGQLEPDELHPKKRRSQSHQESTLPISGGGGY